MGAHRGPDEENLSQRSKDHKAKHVDKKRQPSGKNRNVDQVPDEHMDFESDRAPGGNDPNTR